MKFKTRDALQTLSTISLRRSQYFQKRSGVLAQKKGAGEGPYIEPLTNPAERDVAASKAKAFSRAAAILAELADKMTE